MIRRATTPPARPLLAGRLLAGLLLAGPLLAGSLVLTACSPGPHLASAWTNPAAEATGLAGILVVGPVELPSQSRTYEQVLVSRLERRGIDAEPGERFLRGAPPVDRPRLVRALRDRGLDGVLVTRVIGVEDAGSPAARYTLADREITDSNHLFGFLDFRFGEAVMPGALDRAAVVALAVNLYPARGGALIWSGEIRGVDPSHLADRADLIAELVLDQLENRDLIGR